MADASATALPVPGPFTPLSSLAVLNKADEPLQSPWALPAKTVTLTLPTDDELHDSSSWCQSGLVALPSAPLPTSDGSMMPLNQDELKELNDHVNSGHLTKATCAEVACNLKVPGRCTCGSVRDIDKATHVLHIDIAGPLTLSDDGFTYFLVGALRLPGFLY